jgi:hypothetical protein
MLTVRWKLDPPDSGGGARAEEGGAATVAMRLVAWRKEETAPVGADDDDDFVADATVMPRGDEAEAKRTALEAALLATNEEIIS